MVFRQFKKRELVLLLARSGVFVASWRYVSQHCISVPDMQAPLFGRGCLRWGEREKELLWKNVAVTQCAVLN